MLERNFTNVQVRKYIEEKDKQNKWHDIKSIILNVDYSDCIPTLELLLMFDNETRENLAESIYVMGDGCQEMDTEEEAYAEAENMLKECQKLYKYLTKYYDCVEFDNSIHHC